MYLPNCRGWIVAMTVVVAAALTATTAHAVVIADSVAEFSGVQGQDNWNYGYYDRTADADDDYTSADFQAFTTTGPFPGFTFDGAKWDWVDTDGVTAVNPPWTELTNNGGHPNGTNNGPEHWTVRRWVAEEAGDLQFNLGVEKPNNAGNINARVHYNGRPLLVRNFPGGRARIDEPIAIRGVQIGDVIDFSIDPNGDDGSDGTVFEITVDNAITDGRVLQGGIVAHSAMDFTTTGTQGENGWYAGYHNVTLDGPYEVTPGGTDDFIAFPSDGGPFSATNFWTGADWNWFEGDQPWDHLAQYDAHPNGDNQPEEHWVIRRWESNVDGEIQIDWNLAKQNLGGGNGTTVKVLVNGVEVDSGTVAFDDAVGINQVANATVLAGDFVDIALTAEGTDGLFGDGSDGSRFEASILKVNADVELTWDGDGDGDWGEIVAGFSNWEDAAGPVNWFPDVGSAARATINANTVTVAADRQAVALTVGGTGAVEVAGGQELSVLEETNFADGTSLTLRADSTLRTWGGGSIASLVTDGNATINNRGDISVGSLSDGGVAGTLVKTGIGTLALDNSAKSVSAAATTIKIEQGTVSATGSNPLGGSPAVELAGGRLELKGPVTSPVAVWAFEEGSGNVVADSSPRGNGLDGDIVDGTWVTGDPGRGTVLSLDGDGDFVNVDGLNITSDTVTMAIWLNGHRMEDWAGMMMSANTRNGIGYGDNQNLHYTWNGDSTWAWHDGPALLDDQWMFVAATIEPGKATVYVGSGGVLNSVENAIPHAVETINGLHIGYDFGTRFFNGLVDDAIIFDRALNPAEMADLFAGAVSASASPLELTGTSVLVSQSSTLDVTSDGPAAMGPLTITGGTLTTSGNSGIGFAGTTVAGGVGFETLTDTNSGAITAPGETIVKRGSADLIVDTAGGDLTGATFDVQDGRLVGVHGSNPLEGAALQLSGGEVLLSVKQGATGPYKFDNALSVVENSTLSAGPVAGSMAGPLTVDLGGAVNGVSIAADKTLTLQSSGQYTLNVAGLVNGPGNISMDQGTAALSAGGSIGAADIGGGSFLLRAAADLDVVTMEVTGEGTVDTGAGHVTVSQDLILGLITYSIDATNTFEAAGGIAADAANLTLGGGVLTVSPAAETSLMTFSDLWPGPGEQQGALDPAYSTGLLPGITPNWQGFVWKNANGPDDHTVEPDDRMAIFLGGSTGTVTFSEPLELAEFWMNRTNWGDAGDWTAVGRLAGVDQWTRTIDVDMDVWVQVQEGAGLAIDELAFTEGGLWNHLDDFLFVAADSDLTILQPNVNLSVVADSTIDPQSLGADTVFGNLTIAEGVTQLTLLASGASFLDVTTPQDVTIAGPWMLRGDLKVGGSPGVLTLDPGVGEWVESDVENGDPSYQIEIAAWDEVTYPDPWDTTPPPTGAINDLVVVASGSLALDGVLDGEPKGTTLNLTATSQLRPDFSWAGTQTRTIIQKGANNTNEDAIDGDFEEVPVGSHLGYGVFVAEPGVELAGNGNMEVTLLQALAGDTNGDRVVDIANDGSALILNLGTQTAMDWTKGDFNHDQAVDIGNDGSALILNLGRAYKGGAYKGGSPGEGKDVSPGEGGGFVDQDGNIFLEMDSLALYSVYVGNDAGEQLRGTDALRLDAGVGDPVWVLPPFSTTNNAVDSEFLEAFEELMTGGNFMTKEPYDTLVNVNLDGLVGEATSIWLKYQQLNRPAEITQLFRVPEPGTLVMLLCAGLLLLTIYGRRRAS